MTWQQWIPAAVLFVAFGVGLWRDSRRFGLGLILTAALGMTAVGLFGLLAVGTGPSQMTASWVLLALLAQVVLAVFVLGAFLILNLVTMRRKEGLGRAAILSGGFGTAILVFVTASVTAVASNNADLAGWLVLIGLPAFYVAYLFVSYLMYSQLYQWGTRRFGGPVDTVIVLGSGLGGGDRVTPLLAGRLEQGRAVFDRSVAAGRAPILIVSGGRGSDELISEAEAMKRYLLDRGFPEDSIVREDRSTDTAENLAYSAELMRAWSAEGEVAVATNNYHAFRAAVIMRKAGIPGYTVGCRTARYYWPSATIREFAAILLEHSRVNLAVVGLQCVPLLVRLFNLVTGLF